MDVKTHWDKVYATKAPESVSWFRVHLETSLALVKRAEEASSASGMKYALAAATIILKRSEDLLAAHERSLAHQMGFPLQGLEPLATTEASIHRCLLRKA